MNNDNDRDSLHVDNPENAKLPQGLNVLTILTFIGSGILTLFTVCAPWINDFFLKYLDKELTSGKDHTAKEIAKLEQGKAAIELAKENMIPLMVVGLIAVTLCFIGALWMRKLKKDGFWLYVAGELAPLIAMAFIMGFEYYKSVGNMIGAIIPVVFVILYSFQRKYLIR